MTAAIVLATLVAGPRAERRRRLPGLRGVPPAGRLAGRPGRCSAAEIRALRQDIGARIIVRSTASAVLLLCTLATLWLQQRQLAIRRTLHQVKLLAHDILASMDQGVITTDLRDVITSINSAAIRILGVESECVGRPLASISSGGVPLVALAGQVAERHAAVWDQDFAVDRGGRVRRIRADAHVLKDTRGKAARLRHPPPRRDRAHPDGGAGPADGAVRQPGHPGLRAAPRDQEPADGAEHPRPVAGEAAARPDRQEAGGRADRRAEVRGPPAQRRPGELPRLRQPPAPDPPADRRLRAPRGSSA